MAAPDRRTVGVLGGLGPAATLDFFAKVLRATEAERDQDHLRLIIDNNPTVVCRNASLAGRGPSPGPELAAMAQGLERAGADFLVMVCNTAHAWEADIRASTALPFVGIVDETVRAALSLRPRLRKAGLLAADGCLGAELYQTAFAESGVELLTLGEDDQTRFMALIGRIKAGDTGEAVRADMGALALGLVAGGAELVVAGCTEVPLVLEAADLPVPLISSTDVLVERTVAYARGEPLPERPSTSSGRG